VFITDPKFLAHFVVKVFKEELASAGHGFVDLGTEFTLELVERGLDFLRSPASLVDVGNSFLEIHARLNRAQHFVARSEDAFEELNFSESRRKTC
jgi:hypothetical protein